MELFIVSVGLQWYLLSDDETFLVEDRKHGSGREIHWVFGMFGSGSVLCVVCLFWRFEKVVGIICILRDSWEYWLRVIEERKFSLWL